MTAILKGLEYYYARIGAIFTGIRSRILFSQRQKRIIVDNEDFHLDLLFFHRQLKRLIAIELLCVPHKSLM